MRGKGWSVIKGRPYLNLVASGKKIEIGGMSYVAVVVPTFPIEIVAPLPTCWRVQYPDTTGRLQGLVVWF